MTIWKHDFREDGSHYNGGKVFFGYGYRATTELRLKMVRKWFRQQPRRGEHEDEFFVDGVKVDGYEAALAALAVPVAFSAEEIEALKKIGDEPADLRKEIPFEIWHFLREKGAIKFGPPGFFCRTDVGRAAIQGERS